VVREDDLFNNPGKADELSARPMMANAEWLAETAELVESIAREAGGLLRESIDKIVKRDLKQKRELVTEADQASEDLILDRLRRRFPDHSVMTEESGGHETESRFRWWVDPLDGTNSFAHGHPQFSVSMALELEGEGVVLGVVYDPMRDECYRAWTNASSTLNGRRIRVSGIDALADSLVATGFPYDREKGNENNLPEFNRMILAIQGIRRGGSAALDLCYVAAGRLDAYWELKLKPWDVAAGGVIVRQAGGTVTNIGCGLWDHTIHHIAASNGRVHEEMQKILTEARTSR
jgi:myo-inositol-1(or 4)-monophosphatase